MIHSETLSYLGDIYKVKFTIPCKILQLVFSIYSYETPEPSPPSPSLPLDIVCIIGSLTARSNGELIHVSCPIRLGGDIKRTVLG